MSANIDPLWKAMVEGDQACPDGAALSKLGALMREQTQAKASSGFLDGVLDACKNAGDEDALIDAFYDHGESASSSAADPALGKLRSVARHHARPPEPVDLVPEVLDNLHRRSARHNLGDLDRISRLRIWATVVVGHVAAVVTIVILQGQIFHEAEPVFDRTQTMQPGAERRLQIEDQQQKFDIDTLDEATSQAMAEGLPLRWSQLRDRPEALFLLRQNKELKDLYRRYYGTDTCQATVNAGLSWLRSQQREDGSFLIQPARGSSRALASHSMAILALLADGYHEDAVIKLAVQHLREWVDDNGRIIIDHDAASGDVARGMATLALVEAALLMQDDDLKAAAQLVLDENIPAQRAANAGLDGYFLLAMETASVGGLSVSAADLASIRHRARSRAQQDDVGNLGLMALTRYLYGYRDSSELRNQLDQLGTALPHLDEEQCSDPLRWLFPSLAVREAGGEDWKRWNTSIQRSLLPCFQYDNVDNVAWVQHQRIRYAEDNIFATSLVLLNLQAAHRYIPLARRY